MPTLLPKHANVAMRLIVNGLLKQHNSTLVITGMSHTSAGNLTSELTFDVSKQAQKSIVLSNFSCESFASFMGLLLNDSLASQPKQLGGYFKEILTIIGLTITEKNEPLFKKVQTQFPLVNFKLAVHIALDDYKTSHALSSSVSHPLETAIEESPNLEALKAVLTTAFQTPSVKKTVFCCLFKSQPEAQLALQLNSSTQNTLIGFLMDTFKDFDTEAFGLPLEIDAEKDYRHSDPASSIAELLKALQGNAPIVANSPPPNNAVSQGANTLTEPLLNENSYAIPGPYPCNLVKVFANKDSNLNG